MGRSNTIKVLVAGLGLLALQVGPTDVRASDRSDAPATIADPAADIADLYAWSTSEGTIVVVLTFNSGIAPGASASWDEDVLYTIHIDNTADALEAWSQPFDNDNDNISDIQIHARFAPSQTPGFEDEWAVEFSNVPGSAGPMVGWVETELEDGNTRAWAGLSDDPFFFDSEGYASTLANLVDDTDPIDLQFASVANGVFTGQVHDSQAGTNTHAIVVEFDAADALEDNADGFLQIWATTGRRSR